jgi:polyisoprenoid-binding protein YceI
MLAGTSPSLYADSFKVDGVHSFALFRVRHFNAGNVWGRFNDPAGEFTLDQADPSKDSFAVELKLAKLDTGNAKRDSDLQGRTGLNGRQFQTINFKSTAVKKGEGTCWK